MPDSLLTPPKPLVVAPENKDPKQLFALFHGESAEPRQLLELAGALRQAFPAAAIVLPYGSFRSGGQAYRWTERADPDPAARIDRVAQAASVLAGLVRQLQQHYGVTGQHTALAGFSEGAAVMLEACASQFDLAGRALLFSGRYARLPPAAPPATTLHFLHGADDDVAPVGQIGQVHARLAELHGDATFDIASSVGHEMHPALIAQAILRLQTCVPLRSWEMALDELQQRDAGAAELPPAAGNRTLH